MITTFYSSKILGTIFNPLMVPKTQFAKVRQYHAKFVFVKGLDYRHAKWFLFYVCTDSRVAVCVENNDYKTNL